jgi:hypothetical protein
MLSVLSAALVSGFGMAHLIRRRRALPQDIALIIVCALMAGVGVAVRIVGTRVLQLAVVAAAIGSGNFPQLLHPHKVRVGLLLFLSISSISGVVHMNYYASLYQSQEDAHAAAFLSARIDLDRAADSPIRVFTPYILRGFFGLSDKGSASIRVFFDFDEIDATSRIDYVLAPTATPAFTGSTYLGAKNRLLSTYNVIFNYGDGMIYAAI